MRIFEVVPGFLASPGPDEEVAVWSEKMGPMTHEAGGLYVFQKWLGLYKKDHDAVMAEGSERPMPLDFPFVLIAWLCSRRI